MRRQETKPKEWRAASGDAVRTVRTKSGIGRYTALLRIPE